MSNNRYLGNLVSMIKPLIIMLGVLSFLHSNSKPISSDESFLFCLKKEVNPLTISRSNNVISVDIDELNRFIDEEEIVNIEPWLPGATEEDHDGDIYLNRIYRVYVSENRNTSIPLMISKMSKMPFIHYSEFEYIRKPFYLPNDPMAEIQCTLNAVKSRKAWDFWDIDGGDIPNGRNVLLASVDTGVDYTHLDLQNNSWINQGEIPNWMFEANLDTNSDGYIEAAEVVNFLETSSGDVNLDGEINLQDAVSDGSPFEDNVDNEGNGYIDDLLGWDCSGTYGPDDNDPFPKPGVSPSGTWGHGTHVAGILAATTDNEIGMASTSYNSKFISVKVSRENQTGDEPGISDGFAGILYAAKAGYYHDISSGSFAIINNSWGGGGFNSSENSTINTAYETYGAVIVAAAGNGNDATGGQEYSSHYPSSYTNCISVCAIGCSYAWGNWATYHNTVDLAAPGENIYSTVIGAGYDSWDGSSMASPNAASAIGLLSIYHPDWNNFQLRSRIEESADRRIYEVNPEYETCNGSSGSDCLGHGMVDVFKAIGMDFSPNILVDTSYVQMASDTDLNTLMDNDNILNPGETTTFIVSLENEIGWTNATNVTASLSTENTDVTIISNYADYGNISNNDSNDGAFEFYVDPLIELGDIEFSLDVSGFGDGGYEYSSTLNITVEVSLFQEGFPYDTNSEIKSSPVIVDLDNDGDNEIVLADYFGNVRVIKDGNELDNGIFPFDTGDQIWGAISSADIDLDGVQDFAVASKSGHLYIFDINGIKVDYNAGRWLVATPVIGNIDDDNELEVIVGGYQSPTSTSPIYAINHDGSEVEGFPYIVGEKMKSGAALADMDGNGIDDIIFGTDSDNLYVLLDNLTIAPGFPVDLGHNIRSEPAILDIVSEKIILSGCEDNSLYAINYSDASIRFEIPTGDDVYTSSSFLEGSDGVEIYFGSDDGSIYGLDINGNSLAGFPKNISSGALVGSVVFSDLDDDGDADMIVSDNMGNIYAEDLDGEILQGFPINYQYPFSSSSEIIDYDLDGDLEIVSGSSGDLVIIDVKYTNGNSTDYWSKYKGNYKRSGYSLEGSNGEICSGSVAGDINYDGTINVVDIVRLVTLVLDSSTMTELEACVADLNGDGIINVLDIVSLVNLIIND